MTHDLFAGASFLAGAGRSIDLMGEFDAYNSATDPEMADALAILSDWCTVGDDLRAAMTRPLPRGAHEEESRRD